MKKYMLLKKLSALALIFSLGICSAGCGAVKGSDSASESSANKTSNNGGKKTITVLNYGEYIDREVLDIFEEETGVKVLYEEATTPEEMYAKYKGSAIDYDLICTSDYMIQKLREEDELLEIDMESMEYYENIDERYIELSKIFDPESKYSIPYFWGTIGILYNAKKVDAPVDTWACLFNGDYAGEIIMQNSMRDAYMCALKYKGYSLNTTDRDELDEAQQMLLDQKKDVEAYFVDEVREEMAAENATIAVCYSGEAYLANEYNSNLQYIVPKEGTNLWIDAWCMTKKCQNVEAATEFLDFLCRVDIAELNFEEIYYPTPNKALYEIQDEEIKNDPLIYPSDDVIANCEVQKTLDEETTEYIGEMWKQLKVAE